MGGPGSGRGYRWATKSTVEGHRSLDVRVWHREKLLRPGMWFVTSWSDHRGERLASIGVQVHQERVVLSYQSRRPGQEWQDITEAVSFACTPCHYGGQRLWFICPGWQCGRRVAILYSRGQYFRCRHCYDLVYESQRENGPTRLISKAQKIRQRLGGSASLMEPFPPKPKGMHWQTYERLWWHAQEAEVTGMTAALAQFERLHARSHIDGHHNTSQNLTRGDVQTSVG